jgi:hypothetical protein
MAGVHLARQYPLATQLTNGFKLLAIGLKPAGVTRVRMTPQAMKLPGADEGPRYSALLTNLMRGSAVSVRLR